MPIRIKKVLALVMTLTMVGAAMPLMSAADDTPDITESSTAGSELTDVQQGEGIGGDVSATSVNTETSDSSQTVQNSTTQAVVNENNAVSKTEKTEDAAVEAVNAETTKVEEVENKTNEEGLLSVIEGIGLSLLGIENPVKNRDSGDAVLKAELTSGSQTVELSEADAKMEVDSNSAFSLHIDAVFPPGSDKRIDVSLPYGMSWISNKGYAWNLIDKTESWYANELDRMILPRNQVEDSDKPTVYEGFNLDNGKLTFIFKDSTESVNFDLRFGTLRNRSDSSFNPQLPNISDAVKVEQIYKPEASAAEKAKIVRLEDLQINKLPVLNNIGTFDYSRFTENGKITVPLGGETGYLVHWYAGMNYSNRLNRHITTDYYVRMLAPTGAEYKGIYNTDAEKFFGKNFSNPEIQESGQYINSKGETQEIPDGYTLYTFRTESITPTAYNENDRRWVFNPMWSFSDKEKFTAGTECEISIVDIGVKFYDPEKSKDQCDYVDYDESKLSSTKVIYKIEEPKEKVYVQSKYAATYNKITKKYETTDEGYIADHTLNLGNPGFEHTQEWNAGYFIIGNRGTENSVAKRITLEYDVNKTGRIGITGQMLPCNYNVKNVDDSEISDLQYRLWNSKTGEFTDWLDYAGALPPTGIEGLNKTKYAVLVISDVTNDKDSYFAGIRYRINTVPKQSVLGVDGYSTDKNFPYIGCVLTNDAYSVMPQPAPAGNGSEFLSTIAIEDADEDTALESNKRLGRTFTGTSGVINIEAVHPEWGAANKYTVPIGESGNITAYMSGMGSGGWAGTVEKMWLISPNGTDIENLKVIACDLGDKLMVGGEARYKWIKYDATSKVDIKEVDNEKTLQALRSSDADYANARVWEIDFTGITDPEELFAFRVTGPMARTYKTAFANRPMSYAGYWWETGYISLEYTQKSLYTDPLRKQTGPLLWAKMKDVTTETNSNGDTVPVVYPKENFSPDIYKLSSDDGSQTLFKNTTLTVTPKDSLSVVAGIKSEKNTLYRTYDLKDDNTLVNLKKTVNANLPINYKINLVNNSGSVIDKADVFFPVPKKGNNWGKAINPKGAFKFNMELTANPIDNIPEGYTISYAAAVPESNYLKWGDSDIEWKTADKVADWSTVNFVRISRDSALKNTYNDEFVFNMIASPDAELNEINAWRTTYRAQMSSSTGWAEGAAVGASVGAGSIHGTAWHDSNYNGRKDKGEAIIPGTTFRLYTLTAEGNRGILLDTQVADDKGQYVFEAIRDQAAFEIATDIPSEYKGITILGHIAADSEDNSFSENKTARVEPLTAKAQRNVGFVKSVHTVKYEYTGTVPKNAPKPPGLSRFDIGSKVNIADKPKLSGYTFKGWAVTSPEGLTVTDNVFEMPDGDVLISGSWSEDSSDDDPPSNPATPAKPDIPGTDDINDPDTPLNENPGSGGNKPSAPETSADQQTAIDIGDDETPRAMADNGDNISIVEEYVPKANFAFVADNRASLPQTGQNFVIIELLSMLGIVFVASGTVVTLYFRRKNR